MKAKTNIKLDLTDLERKNLRKNRIKKSKILEYGVDELAILLDVLELRAKELYALADFQRIPSIGIEFAKDLIFLGYYSINELGTKKSGSDLINLYEKKKRYQVDPCVEDQFRLVIDFAKHKDYSKKWWDFTAERKEYRKLNGYPKDRPR